LIVASFLFGDQLTNQPPIAPDTDKIAQASETAVDVQPVQKLQTKVVSLHPETESQTQL